MSIRIKIIDEADRFYRGSMALARRATLLYPPDVDALGEDSEFTRFFLPAGVPITLLGSGGDVSGIGETLRVLVGERIFLLSVEDAEEFDVLTDT